MFSLSNPISGIYNYFYGTEGIQLGEIAKHIEEEEISVAIKLCEKFPLYINEIQKTIENYINGENGGVCFDKEDECEVIDFMKYCANVVFAKKTELEQLNKKEKEILLKNFYEKTKEFIPENIMLDESILCYRGDKGEMRHTDDHTPLDGISISYDGQSQFLYEDGFPVGEFRDNLLYTRSSVLYSGEGISLNGEGRYLYYKGEPVGYFEENGDLISLKNKAPFCGEATDKNGEFACLYQNGKQVGIFMHGEKEPLLLANDGEQLFSGEVTLQEEGVVCFYQDGKVKNVFKTLYKASLPQISVLRNEMASFLKEKIVHDDIIMFYFQDAIRGKFESIPENDPFWSNERGSRSEFDFRIKTQIFPNENKNIIMEYIDGGKELSNELKMKIIDIFILTNSVHPYKDLADIFCQQKNIETSMIEFQDNHFFIKGKEKSFIPDDGNCFFHCVAYLLQAE